MKEIVRIEGIKLEGEVARLYNHFLQKLVKEDAKMELGWMNYVIFSMGLSQMAYSWIEQVGDKEAKDILAKSALEDVVRTLFRAKERGII